MKMESAEFTKQIIDGFSEDLVGVERDRVVERLEVALEDLQKLQPRLEEISPDDAGWAGMEVLAHIASFTEFFGWIGYNIAKGRPIEMDVLSAIQLRDQVIAQTVETQGAGEIIDKIKANVDRTLGYLKTAPPAELRNQSEIVGRLSSADEVFHYQLCGHLEQHVDQLRKALN
jgi:hypothetical protein